MMFVHRCYHGLHRRVVAKSCQCRTVGEVSGHVLNHKHSCLSGTRTGSDSHDIYFRCSIIQMSVSLGVGPLQQL